MQITSTGSVSYSTQTSSNTSDRTIKELEKQRMDIQDDLQEATLSEEDSETKQQNIQRLQQQLQQIELRIQQLQREKEKEQTKVQEVNEQEPDSLQISAEANVLYTQSQENK
ncbi:FlxA-like family protein [Peribacillus asahii]|uniref:FlxA-like family protein n=1 Tax=Peribacillus asahii TaxID=228899 RepID=UPI003823643D